MGRKEFKNMKSYMKAKRKTKDIDEIETDLKPDNKEKLLNQKIDYDVTGNAQFYCVHCARYFVDDKAMKEHERGKPHKRRMKQLETEAYSIEEAERAGGMGSYVAPRKRKISGSNTENNDQMDESDDVVVKKKKKK